MTIFDNIQDNINPGDDFYKFATGKWLANNPQPDEYPRWCNFTKLDDDNIKRINDIIFKMIYFIIDNEEILFYRYGSCCHAGCFLW